MILKSVAEQLAEPDAEQEFAAKLKELQAKSPFNRTAVPNAPRPNTPPRIERAAREYRITIPISDDSERVTKDTPLEVGTRCSAEWARKWNAVTITSLRENGDVEVKWEGWNSIEPVTRSSLTIDKKTLAELIAKPKPDR